MPLLFALVPLLLSAAGPPIDTPAGDVQEAILAAARQSFEGRIGFHKEALYPPRPEMAEQAKHFDPDRATQNSTPEVNAQQRQTYAKIHRSMLEQARGPYFRVYDSAITLGPNEAIRVDRYFPDAPPSITVLNRVQAWYYRAGLSVLTICEAAALDDPPTMPALALQMDIRAARHEAGRFVNQKMRAEFADAVQSVEGLANGSVVAELSTPQGPMTIRFKRVDGHLRVSTIVKTRDGKLCKTSFSRYVQVGTAWIPRRVEYTERPVGSTETVDLRTTREVTSITLLEAMDSDPFARPNPYDAKYAELMYEHDVSAADNPMVPLRERLEPQPVAAEGLER